MRNSFRNFHGSGNEHGVTAVIVGLCLVMLLSVAATVIDLGHLYLVRNELQNASDAGALAGARFLLNSDDGSINTDANTIAADAATANQSDGMPITEVEVQRGHWCFCGGNGTFTPNDATEQAQLWNHTFEELDSDPGFINAVRVVTRRGAANPVTSFLAQIFDIEGFFLEADAVAYRGFVGDLAPFEIDQPIAICSQAITQPDGSYTCNKGRMINSGQNVESHETGGWTDFSQDSPCSGGTNSKAVRDLICADGNPDPIYADRKVATNGGEIQSAFNDLVDCWKAEADSGDTDTIPDQLWNVNLLVVNCPDNNVGTCEDVMGAVNVDIVWINEKNDPQYKNVPRKMADWSCGEEENGTYCWDRFVEHFNLKDVDGTDAPYQNKAIYFLPDCDEHEPLGRSGGSNFGILAELPRLVE